MEAVRACPGRRPAWNSLDMSTSTEYQSMNLAAQRPVRSLKPTQQRAYRQLAIAVLRLDVATLTSELRARRLQVWLCCAS